MFCPSCRAEIADNADFCTKCGAKTDATDPDRKQSFKERTAAKWNRVLAKQFGIGPDAGPEGPAPTYDWWRNTLAVLTTLFLAVVVIVILVVTLSRD